MVRDIFTVHSVYPQANRLKNFFSELCSLSPWIKCNVMDDNIMLNEYLAQYDRCRIASARLEIAQILRTDL